MSLRIQWSRQALDDLKSQIAFISKDNPKAARQIARKLRLSAERLAQTPSGRPGRVLGTWEKSVTGLPYVMAYTIRMQKAAETLVVLRVIQTARDWQTGTWPD
ncbi:MAG: type II toxin-antitoxin system RelE/ParE family toxin [Agrobacterium tumefaciens]